MRSRMPVWATAAWVAWLPVIWTVWPLTAISLWAIPFGMRPVFFKQKLVDGWQTELPDFGCPAERFG